MYYVWEVVGASTFEYFDPDHPERWAFWGTQGEDSFVDSVQSDLCHPAGISGCRFPPYGVPKSLIVWTTPQS